MKRIIFTVSLFLLVVGTYANDKQPGVYEDIDREISYKKMDGIWKGFGTHKSSLGTYKNAPVQISLFQNSSSLTSEICWKINRNGYNINLCSGAEMNIKNQNQLWLQDTFWGEIMDNYIHINFSGIIEETIKLNDDGTLNYYYKTFEQPSEGIECEAINLTRF